MPNVEGVAAPVLRPPPRPVLVELPKLSPVDVPLVCPNAEAPKPVPILAGVPRVVPNPELVPKPPEVDPKLANPVVPWVEAPRPLPIPMDVPRPIVLLPAAAPRSVLWKPTPC